MKKSVYSLVLMDDVVEAIDRLAYERNTNRSNLINQILAENVNFITPEMRMRDIFTELENILSESCYQILDRSSDSMFALRSPIRYKYRPMINYTIELFREPKDIVGRLKVSFRTSSRNFTDAVENFFTRWIRMENDCLSEVHPEGVPSDFENAKYIRGFLKVSDENELTENDIAVAIGEYIKVLDKCIKFYFEHLEDEELIEKMIHTSYKEYLESGVYVA
ncbi:MAG: hypothetical protein ACTTKY_03550 [Catonella sp.]